MTLIDASMIRKGIRFSWSSRQDDHFVTILETIQSGTHLDDHDENRHKL